MIKGVIFDMDGVIFDSEYACLKAFKETIESAGLVFDMDTYMKLIGVNYAMGNQILNDYYGKEWEPLWDQWDVRFQKMYHNHEILPKKGAIEIINYLNEKKVPIALATSGDLSKVERSFLNSDFKQIPFKYICTGDKVTHSKPNPEIFLKASEILGIDIKDCFVIEDSKNGCLASINAGSSTICVPDIQPITDESIKEKIPYTFNDLFEVKDFLTKFLNL